MAVATPTSFTMPQRLRGELCPPVGGDVGQVRGSTYPWVYQPMNEVIHLLSELMRRHHTTQEPPPLVLPPDDTAA